MTAAPLIQNNVTMSRPEEVEAILNGIELFNPDNLPRLEHYFGVQCRKNEYDHLANLAILELYQFNPQLVNPSIIVSILAKALTVLPGPDFNTYSCLLTQKTTEDAGVQQLFNLHKLFQSGQFEEFWTLVADSSVSELLSEISNFKTSMRLVISQIISVTFQQISKSQLLKFLNLKDNEEEFNTLIQTLGWELSEGDLVKIQSNQFNEVKQGNVDETIKVQQLSKLFSFIN